MNKLMKKIGAEVRIKETRRLSVGREDRKWCG